MGTSTNKETRNKMKSTFKELIQFTIAAVLITGTLVGCAMTAEMKGTTDSAAQPAAAETAVTEVTVDC